MRFLSCVLLFVVSVSLPSLIVAQNNDDSNVLHISAVSMPSIVADTNNIIETLNEHNNDNDNNENSGILFAPPLIYHDNINDESTDDSSMFIAVDSDDDGVDDEGLSGESLLFDYKIDDSNTIDLFTSMNEQLKEDGIESLLDADYDIMMDSDATIDNDIDIDNDDDNDNDSFDIADGDKEKTKKEMKLKSRRPLRRRAFIRRGKKAFMKRLGDARYAWRKGLKKQLKIKRAQRVLKLMVLSKKLKALDMKMNLMKLISRTIRMRLMEKGISRGGGLMERDRDMISLRSRHSKLMKKLMILKMIKLMHLLYECTLGVPVYHRSGMRLSPKFLLRHILRHTLRYPSLGKAFSGLRLKSLIMKSFMKSFLNNIKYLIKKSYLLKKKGMMAAGNQHRLYVKADRAIVNVGDGNEWKPIFYRSRAAPRVSVDDSNFKVPVRIRVPAPGMIMTRRRFADQTRME